MPDPQTIRWPIPLHSQPQLMQAAFSYHGEERSIERYVVTHFWQIHLYRHDAELRLRGDRYPAANGISVPIRSGTVSVLPPEIVSEYHLQKRSEYVYAHFRFPNSGTKAEGNPNVTIPVIQHLGDETARFQAAFDQIIGVFSTRPWRAEVRLWETLCQLTERAEPGEDAFLAIGHGNPAVERARRLIELRLSEPLTIAAIADEVGLSQSQLTRLFQLEVGSSPRKYLLARRVERARHLLIYTTRPIKAIAREVGIADLHQFNKTLRRAIDIAPRELRQRGG